MGGLLTRLCADNEPLQNAIFDQDGELSHVRVLLDGRDVELAQGLNTPLVDSDQLDIFPPIAAG
ncbi:MoaD/ThiS family protein [Chloroflexota bacterium]